MSWKGTLKEAPAFLAETVLGWRRRKSPDGEYLNHWWREVEVRLSCRPPYAAWEVAARDPWLPLKSLDDCVPLLRALRENGDGNTKRRFVEWFWDRTEVHRGFVRLWTILLNFDRQGCEAIVRALTAAYGGEIVE